ncbi:MAG: hypothetical protein QME68_08980 [Elusimicrobiota bacterium]|nr:hypothetical protein [Elusimicrobiota bacterium]
MTQFQIKKIGMKWILTTVSVIFAIVGVVIGIFTFFFFPTGATAGLGVGAKLLALLIFVILYTLIMMVGILIVVWLYNKISLTTGSITFFTETKEE